MVLTSAWWRFLENYVYHTQEPPPRTRTNKSLQVICVGPPRSATESLQQGLIRLGYDYTYHGWDILFEKPNRSRAWSRLARRKWLGDAPGLPITAAEFDEILGHAEAVVDAPASCFAAELIAAYPDAKVVLNTRKNLDAWMSSMEESVLAVNRSWLVYVLSWFDSPIFWAWHAYERLLWPGLFRCIDSREGFVDGTRARGKLVYQEHCNMIRGLVPSERLLEWSVQDGWEPLCKFLGKEIPDEPFPHVNSRDKGWKEKEARWMAELVGPAMRNMTLATVAALGGVIAAGVSLYRR